MDRPVAQIDYFGHPGRIFVVGDLHGMAHSLRRLLERAEFDEDRDVLWSLGDLIDRGPYSEDCINLLTEPWFNAIRGNHEQLMLDAIESDTGLYFWLDNGGDWAFGSDWDSVEVTERISALPWAAELETAAGRYGLVHADVARDTSWSAFVDDLIQNRESARETALWSRISASSSSRGVKASEVDGIDKVLVGHTIMEKARFWGNRVFLDTGAALVHDQNAALTMLQIHPQEKLWRLSTAGDREAQAWWDEQPNRFLFSAVAP